MQLPSTQPIPLPILQTVLAAEAPPLTRQLIQRQIQQLTLLEVLTALRTPLVTAPLPLIALLTPQEEEEAQQILLLQILQAVEDPQIRKEVDRPLHQEAEVTAIS